MSFSLSLSLSCKWQFVVPRDSVTFGRHPHRRRLHTDTHSLIHVRTHTQRRECSKALSTSAQKTRHRAIRVNATAFFTTFPRGLGFNTLPVVQLQTHTVMFFFYYFNTICTNLLLSHHHGVILGDCDPEVNNNNTIEMCLFMTKLV